MILQTSRDVRLVQRRIPEAWDLHYSIAATIAVGPGHSYPVMIFEILISF